MSEGTNHGGTANNAASKPHLSLGLEEVRELIASRAYELYKCRGTELGDDVSDWLKAEGEVVSMLAGRQYANETGKRNGRAAVRSRTAASVRKAANAARSRVSSLSKGKNSLKGDPA